MEKEDFLEENYIKEEIIVNIVWANVFGIIILIIVILLFGIPFYFLWSDKWSIQIINPIMGSASQHIMALKKLAITLLILYPLTAIHGIFIVIFAKNRFKSIKFGIAPARKLFSPYCHSKEKLKINYYKIVIMMPLIIMGIIPTIISIIIWIFDHPILIPANWQRRSLLRKVLLYSPTSQIIGTLCAIR